MESSDLWSLSFVASHRRRSGYHPDGYELAIGEMAHRSDAFISDIDGDGADDLVLYGFMGARHHDDNPPENMSVYSFQEYKYFNEELETLDSRWGWHRLTPEVLGEKDNDGQHPRMIILDIDADFDSTVLEQASEETKGVKDYKSVERIFHDNVIIAAVAGPPCNEDLGQDLSDCSAGFGQGVSGSLEVGAGFTTSTAFWVGVEAEAQAGAGVGAAATGTVYKARAMVKAYASMSFYGSVTTTLSTTITNFAGPGEDLVIFTAVPVNRYRFEAVSVDEGLSGEDDLTGEDIVIDIPLGERIMAVSRDYYNATNGTQQDIGYDIIPSTPGEIDTYMSFSEVGSYIDGNIPLAPPSPPLEVSQVGHQEIDVELDVEGMLGQSTTLGVEVEGETCICGIGFGASDSKEVSAYVNVSLATNSHFSSSVAALSTEAW